MPTVFEAWIRDRATTARARTYSGLGAHGAWMVGDEVESALMAYDKWLRERYDVVDKFGAK